MARKTGYATDASDEEWEFCAPYLALMDEGAPQRVHSLRELFNALRYISRAGLAWRLMPNDFPPWHACYQQAQRWFKAGVFEAMAHDLRALLRMAQHAREATPSAAIIDSRTIQSTRESGALAGYDGAKKRKGRKAHIAVDSLGHLLALVITPANEQDRDQVGVITKQVQEATGQSVKVAFADAGYTGEKPADAAKENGIDLQIIKLPEAKKGFVLLPKRWVVERTFGWQARFRRIARDYERLNTSLAGYHWVATVMLLLGNLLKTLQQSA